MIIALVILAAALGTWSVKSNTTLGLFQSAVLGLLCVVPFLSGLLVDALNLLVSLMFRLAFALAGTSAEELKREAILRKIQDSLPVGKKVEVRVEKDLTKKDDSDTLN